MQYFDIHIQYYKMTQILTSNKLYLYDMAQVSQVHQLASNLHTVIEYCIYELSQTLYEMNKS